MIKTQSDGRTRAGGWRRLAKPVFAGGGMLLLVAALPAAALGQEGGAVRSITFEEAIEIALERNPTVLTARNNLQLDAIAVRQQRSSFLPDLRFSTNTSQRYGRNFSQDEGQIINTTTNSVNGSVSTGVTLFDGFSNVASLRSARLTEQAGVSELERAEETVVFTVMTNYLSLIEAREQLRVQEESLASQETLERDIAARVEQQTRPISDLYQQQATVASARLALVQAQRSAALAEMTLVQTLQLDPMQEYSFEIPELDAVGTEFTALSVEEATERALAQRADYQAAQTLLQASEQSVRVARASYWPTISLSANYSSNFSSTDPSAFFDQLDNRRGGSVGLSFSIPLFDRLNARNATERARVQVDNSRINLESLRQNVAVQVRTGLLDLRSAEEQLVVAEAQLRAAELALEFSQQRYDLGAASLVELTQAQAAQARAAGDLVSARYRLEVQRRVMDYYLGGMVIGE